MYWVNDANSKYYNELVEIINNRMYPNYNLNYKQIKTSEYCAITQWLDRYVSRFINDINALECINDDVDYDYIVVAVEKKELYYTILEDLIKFGIDRRKIVWCSKKIDSNF